MAAFEFGSFHQNPHNRANPPEVVPEPIVEEAVLEMAARPAPVIQEPILTMKIYDSCRSKDCLTPQELGPARDLSGDPVRPPDEARSVSVDNLTVGRIGIMKKQPSPFRNGFWDLEIQYLLAYELKYFSADGQHIDIQPAISTVTRRLSLFGSVGRNISTFTDLLGNSGLILGNGEPFVHVEAKAMPLTAELSRRHCDGGHGSHHRHVFVTFGLFSIVKLYRLASLLVESRGFLIPPKCKNLAPTNPCDFFEELHFPMDSFSPPQKKEFIAGVSLDIPADGVDDCLCAASCELEE
ncbi:MAG: hypothetical protein FWE21_09685 [Defluviitaleaceae bacterium]|nr:hypothetical protein [Defluviitaleaceae bacterium]